MLIEANSWIVTAWQSVVTALLATTPSAKVHLAQPPFTPNPTSSPSTFTEANFTGYAALVLGTWDATHLDGKGNILSNSLGLAHFVPSGVLTTPQQIAGYWLVDQAGNYIGGEAFATPVTLSGPTTPLEFTVGVPVRPGTFSTDVLP